MELSAGDSFICLLSPDVYALDNASNAFMTLSELGISEEGSEDGVAIVFKSLPFASYSSVFDKLPDDTLVVFRRLGASASAKGQSEQERFDNQKKVFIRLCGFGK